MTKHWEHCEKSHTKIAKRVLGALNKDIVSVVFDEKVFWFEPVVSYIKIPNYVRDYLIRFYKKLGYKYLYE